MGNKILITSDWHVQSGIYTDIAINYMDYLLDYCKENDITKIIIAGDIFEKSSKIKNDAFIPLFFKFKELKNEGIDIVILLGNHDIYNADNDSLVETFSVFGEVIKDSTLINIYGREFTFLAYTKDETKLPTGGDILITHLSIADFSFDNNYHVNEKAGFKRNKFNKFNYVFTGHFHRPQDIGNIIYMGSPYQMNFGEIDQKKGFVVFDVDEDKWIREWYTEAPVYKKIKVEEFDDIDVSNAFVQVEIEEKLDSYVQLKHLLFSKGALDVSPKFINESNNISVDDKADIDMNNSINSMVKEYILNNVEVEENIDKQKLISIFDKLVSEL